MSTKRDRIKLLIEAYKDRSDEVDWVVDEIMSELRKAQAEAYSNGYQKGKKGKDQSIERNKL